MSKIVVFLVFFLGFFLGMSMHADRFCMRTKMIDPTTKEYLGGVTICRDKYWWSNESINSLRNVREST